MCSRALWLVVIIAVFGGFAISSPSAATTIKAGSCSQSDVQTAVASAGDGDIVSIPAGSCSWETAVSWKDKNISLIGAGMEKTIITLSASGAFSVVAETKPKFRISSMTFRGDPSGRPVIIAIRSDGISTPVTGWRVDHVKIASTASAINSITGFFITGMSWGVIDNCVFEGIGFVTVSVASYVSGESGSEKGMGWHSYDWPLNLGNEEAVYVEDCTWNFASLTGGAVNDLVYGGRIVFRRNVVHNSYFMTHSARGNDRGGFKYEIYDNTFVGGGFVWPAHIRSGTGVIFNNKVSGYQINNFIVDNQRTCTNFSGLFRRCDGTQSADGNAEGDEGWPCLDQVGRGSGYPALAQESVPLYAWNNGSSIIAVNNDFDLCTTTTPTLFQHIRSTPHGNGDVDFVNGGNTAKPGYVSYQYPHPLRGLSKPNNLRIE